MPPRAQSPAHAVALADSRLRGWFAAGLIALAALVAYHNSLRVPFIFDDRQAVVENPTIRHWSTALFPPGDNGSGVRGRPLVNLSLALNYAVGGLDVRGYHALNLLVHVSAALVLYGIVRRTLRRPRLSARFGGVASQLALVVAVSWAVHPLLTESVTCIVQRTESLAGLFYLLTLYGFVRATEPDGSKRWLIASVAAALLGVLTKEILATAPLLVLLYDFTFGVECLPKIWPKRRGYFLALLATWLPLAGLVFGADGRGGTVGFGVGILWWEYAFRQCAAIVSYVGLGFWPHPLVLDYGIDVVHGLAAVWPQALLLGGGVAGTIWALRRRHATGFLGAWFFVVLAPSSSVLPLATQTMAEHRVYLPLAALVTGGVVASYRWLGRRSLLLGWLGAIALAVGTMARNETYRTALSIWADTASQRPGNARAHSNLAVELLDLKRLPEAERELRAALSLAPNYADALANLGQMLVNSQRPAEAVPVLEHVLALRPDYFSAQFSLATAFDGLGRPADAIVHYDAAVRLQPDSALANFGLGTTLAATGRVSTAVAPLEKAVRLQPESALMQATLASALAAVGRGPEALAHFETALRLQPDSAETHFNFGLLLAQTGDYVGARQQWERALELKPDYAEVRASLEQLRDNSRRAPTAP